MIEELLTLTRAEEASLTHFERVAVDDVITAVIEDVVFENEQERGKISARLQNLFVSGDALLLNRALSNVIHNAIRYTAPGTSVEIVLRQEKERVVITIEDHGKGVPEAELDKIFLPYYRSDEARERSKGGVGLGLAITKRIIESHGGRITASNASAGGLVVTIDLRAVDA
jgi:two-component system sensor histidine kinase CpxA